MNTPDTTVVIDRRAATLATNLHRDTIAAAQTLEFEAIIHELGDHHQLHGFYDWLGDITGIQTQDDTVVALGIVDPRKLLAQYVASTLPNLPLLDRIDLVKITIDNAYHHLGYTETSRKTHLAGLVLKSAAADIDADIATALVAIVQTDFGIATIMSPETFKVIQTHDSAAIKEAFAAITGLKVNQMQPIG